MVAACGFHSGHDSREVFTVRSNSLHQFRETAFIHSGRQGKTNIALDIKACGRKRILRYINTDKETIQGSTSVKSYSDKAGEASRPILHDDKGSKTQSTYYGYGRQGTDSFEGSLTQVIWSSPACPTLTGKTRLYKSYNTNLVGGNMKILVVDDDLHIQKLYKGRTGRRGLRGCYCRVGGKRRWNYLLRKILTLSLLIS